ncbi:MAG: hypothetical protein ASARMPRED_006132 [Alectoria sarmentosa]|nr:MAG: hypothetical protein ASARMPRED_006132 [Alectoria sarmentosa]
MDPLTAFSLACGVIQVVDFSTKTLMKCKEIYKDGSLSEYQELEDLTSHLVDVRAGLDLASSHQSAESIHNLDDQSLLNLAEECSATAHQLMRRIHSLKMEGPRNKRQAVFKTIKLLWEKGEIQDIQKRLEGYRNALDTKILIYLRQRFDLASLEHSKEFQDLDQKIQKLINDISQGPKTFEELKDLLQNEYEKSREHVGNEFQEHERRLADEEHRRRLLESLWFDKILSREETIDEAHSETLQWIFDRSGQAVRPWDNFIAWLESGEGIYWISGKAGSGKSTLMSLLCQDQRTIDALTAWSSTKDILMPRFFFWSGGTMVQKSLEGLLRSLLWQILNERPELSILSSNIRAGPERNRSISHEHGPIGAWTKRRLQKALLEAMDQLQGSCRLCFFIDGLDEFDEDEDDLITLVQDIASSTGVKVCSSSRPYKVFEDAFGSSAKLRLQDLTFRDIRQYVTDMFQGVPQLKSMTSENEHEMNELKEEIVTRAEGVFLWVSLAVKDQIRGLRNEDSPEQLQDRLASLPSEVEGIYLRMLLHIDRPYRQEASRFLQMALHKPGLTLFEHALASYKSLEEMLLSADETSEREYLSLCRSTRNRIMVTCVGLLEVHEPPTRDAETGITSDWSSELDSLQLEADPDDNLSTSDSERETIDDSDGEQERGLPNPEVDTNKPKLGSETELIDPETLALELNITVDFVHRTAIDFLTVSDKGREFLHANSSPDFNPQVFYVKASLGKLRLLWYTNLPVHSQVDIDTIMEGVALAEDRTGAAQTELYFLSLAASHGLCHYVEQRLDCREKSGGPETLDYLLWYSTTSINDSPNVDFPLTRVLKVVTELLRRGANPNTKILKRTIWEEFQEQMLSRLGYVIKTHLPSKTWDDITPAISAFLECGADVHTIWTYHFSRVMYLAFLWDETILAPEKTDRRCSFDMQLSALSVIQLCLRSEPVFPRIWEMCLARGALSHSKCTILEVVSFFDDEKSTQNKKRYELSEQESNDFLELFEQFIAFCKTEYDETPGPLQARMVDLRRRISEFYDMLDEVRPYSSTSRFNYHPIAHKQGSEWSTYTSRFQPGTLGIEVAKAEARQEYFEAGSGFDATDRRGNFPSARVLAGGERGGRGGTFWRGD